MYCPTVPYYDESFIHDDNLNQRRNKRSYRVYKNGLSPLNFFEPDVIQALEERGTSVIKRNIKNIKNRGQRYRVDTPIQSASFPNHKSDVLTHNHYPRISVFDPKRFYDFRNNNITNLTPCKSFDNLTLKKQKELIKDTLKNGVSLQNLTHEDSIKHYVSPVEDGSRYRKTDFRNSYSVVEARRRPVQRRISRSTAVPGVGIYRKIIGDSTNEKKSNSQKYGMNICLYIF